MLGNSNPRLLPPLPTVAGDMKGASRGPRRQPDQLAFIARPTGMGTLRFSQQTQHQEGPRPAGGDPLGLSHHATNRPLPDEAPAMTANRA